MPPEAISVRVPDDLLAAVDILVQAGVYAGRSDFIVKAVRRAVGPTPVESDSTKNILLLPFRAEPWPATAPKNLAPHPAGLDWLLDEMGVITLHAGAPSIGTICVLPTLGRDGYRVCNLWYRYLSGTAMPGVHFVRPGGEVDLLPSPGKNHLLDLWDHPEANGASLDYDDKSGTAPVLRAFPVLRAPNVIYAGLEAQGAPGSFVSFQLYAVVERVAEASRLDGRSRASGLHASMFADPDVRGPFPMGDGIMPARGETRRPAEPENAHQGTSTWIQASRGRRVRYEVQRVRKGSPEGPVIHAATVQQGVSGDWLWQTFRALSRVPILRADGREATVEDAMARADEVLIWDGWELPGAVSESAPSEITRDLAWEDGFRKRIDSGAMDGSYGEHRGVWYQGSAGADASGSRHYLVNHVDGELGKLGGVYATEAHVRAAIDGYLDMAELLEKRVP